MIPQADIQGTDLHIIDFLITQYPRLCSSLFILMSLQTSPSAINTGTKQTGQEKFYGYVCMNIVCCHASCMLCLCFPPILFVSLIDPIMSLHKVEMSSSVTVSAKFVHVASANIQRKSCNPLVNAHIFHRLGCIRKSSEISRSFI